MLSNQHIKRCITDDHHRIAENRIHLICSQLTHNYTSDSSSSTKDALQSQSIHGREYFIDKHELHNHSITEQRIDEFTEWRLSFHTPLPSNTSCRVTGMCALSDGSICVKLNDPVSVYCYTAYSAYTKYYTVDFTNLFPIYETFGSNVLLCPMPNNKLILYSKQQNMLVYTAMPSKQPEAAGGFAMTERGSGTIKLATIKQKSSVTQCYLPQSTTQLQSYDRHLSHTQYNCIDTLSSDGMLLFYAAGGTALFVLDTLAECSDHTANQPIVHVVDGQTYTEWQHRSFVGEWYAHKLHIQITSIVCIDKHQLLVTDVKQLKYIISSFLDQHCTIQQLPDTNDSIGFQQYNKSYILQTNVNIDIVNSDRLSKEYSRQRPIAGTDEGVNEHIQAINTTQPTNLFLPYDNQSNTLFHYTLADQMYDVQTAINADAYSHTFVFDTSMTIPLNHTKQIAVPCSKRLSSADHSYREDYYIAIIDVSTLVIRYIHVKPLTQHSQISIERLSAHNANSGQLTTFTHTARPIGLCETYNGELAVCDTLGFVRMYTVDTKVLDQSVAQWRSLFGASVSESTVNVSVNGKIKQQPHKTRDADTSLIDVDVEDDTDEEGEGGENGEGTSGKGGIGSGGTGGKSNSAKAERGKGKGGTATRDRVGTVSDEARKAAQALSAVDLEARLQQIELGNDDNILYDQYLSKVQKQISQLRMILESTEAKQHERQWLKNQNQGDLDDNKLIDALTGERLVYRRRGLLPPEHGTPQRLAKRLMFVCDVSGSMYRFNSSDNRLQRLLESVVLILESFINLEHKYNYCIVGHSGDGAAIPFVPFDNPPKTRAERLKVLQKMFAHTETCSSGDNTVDAIIEGIKSVSIEPGDEYFVLTVSDANLSRYGIGAEQLSNALLRNNKVNAYILFLAQSGDEAVEYIPKLPPNRAYFVEDTAKLPQVFKDMFTSSKVISE